MKKVDFTQGMKAIVVLLTMLCGAVGAWAGNPSVKYVSRTWDEKNNKLIEKTLYVDDYIVLDGTDATKEIYLEDENAWYVAKDYEVKYSRIIVSSPRCHLIITDDSQLEAQICIPQNHELTIYGQEEGLGRLIAEGKGTGVQNEPGIGCSDDKMGVLNIEGCYIIAHGDEGSAGIGGGNHGLNIGNDGGIVRIFGGKVKAYGGRFAAGIGGSQRGNGGELYIYGGNIYAGGGEDAAGIGSGEGTNEDHINGGTVKIYGGRVFADGRGWGAGIGSGEDAYGANVEIYGGIVESRAGGNAAQKNGSAVGSENGDDHRGTLTIADNMTVFAGTAYDKIEREFPGDERTDACFSHPFIRLEAAPQSASKAKSVAFRNTTGIEKVDTITGNENNVWYSLKGTRYTEKPSIPGIYIVNGKKVVIK